MNPTENDLQKQIICYLCDEVHRDRIKWAAIQKKPFPVVFGEFGSKSKQQNIRFIIYPRQQGNFATKEQIDFFESIREENGVAHTVWSLNDVKSVLFGEIDVHLIENDREEIE